MIVQIEEVIVYKEEIHKIMEKLEERKATGPDGVSSFIFKQYRNQLVGPIYDIMMCSISTCQVPKEWRRAEVVPIKIGERIEEPLNYRTVSLISIVCKICEK